MYVAFQNLHPPLQVPKEYVERYPKEDQSTINGMAAFLDDSMGNITAALKRTGLWQNTLLVYSPDNGGYQGNGGDDAPLRGGKFSDFEGGTRVAAFASGGFLPEAMRGTSVSGMIHVADWYATFCALAGVEDVTDRSAAAAGLPPLDSVDVSGLLLGTNATSPRTEVVLSAFNPAEDGPLEGPRYFGKGEAIVAGPDGEGKLWKLILGSQLSGPFGDERTNACEDGSGWGPGHTGVDCSCGATGCLYELTSDENEARNVAAEHSDVAQRLLRRLDVARATVYAPNRGVPDPAACDANDRNGGFWSPWLNVESAAVV